MSRDGKFEKSQEDVRDTVAEETKEDIRDTVAENLEEKYFTDQTKKLREKTAQIVEDDKHIESETPKIKGESYVHSINPAATEKGKVIFNMMGRKPVVTLVIIGAIVLGGILLYASVQYGNQSDKEEKFSTSWNQSLDGLRSGNVTVTQYCNQNPHDQKLCDLFWNLKYM
jgi:cytochrome c-type biogenesis protein CcmH/NrfG